MNLCEELHVHDWHWISVRTKPGGEIVEVWRCQVCGKEEERPYTGTYDTVEYRL